MYVLVTRNQCNFCDLAKEILKGSGIMYVEYNVQSGSSRWILDLLRKAGYTTVPQVWDSQGNHIGGYTELKEALVREL
jgi:glutaredoxin